MVEATGPTPARSYLYVPGDRPDRFAKAARSGADAVVLDLEDGVGTGSKDRAHDHVAAARRTEGPQWWIRLDPARLAEGVEAAVVAGTTGVFVPGAEPELLASVVDMLADAEAVTKTAPLLVVPLIETAAGVLRVCELAVLPRVHRIGLGEADLAAELGIRPSQDRRELWPIRSNIVVASAAARLVPPVGPAQTLIRDEKVLMRSTRQLVRQGFSARTLIHPDQVAIVHEHLAPTADEIKDARAVLAAYEAAQASDSGVAVDSQGRLVDVAVVRSARAVLSRAKS